MLTDKMRKGAQGRALILAAVLAGVYLLAVGQLCFTSVFVEKTRGRESYLSRLSLTDSAIVRLDKRFAETGRKTSRHQAAHGTLSANDTLRFIDFRCKYPASGYAEGPPSLISISPPNDRAPPRS